MHGAARAASYMENKAKTIVSLCVARGHIMQMGRVIPPERMRMTEMMFMSGPPGEVYLGGQRGAEVGLVPSHDLRASTSHVGGGVLQCCNDCIRLPGPHRLIQREQRGNVCNTTEPCDNQTWVIHT